MDSLLWRPAPNGQPDRITLLFSKKIKPCFEYPSEKNKECKPDKNCSKVVVNVNAREISNARYAEANEANLTSQRFFHVCKFLEGRNLQLQGINHPHKKFFRYKEAVLRSYLANSLDAIPG